MSTSGPDGPTATACPVCRCPAASQPVSRASPFRSAPRRRRAAPTSRWWPTAPSRWTCAWSTRWAASGSIPMQDRRYGIWHTFVPGVRPGQRYGYRVTGRDRSKILLDPYARRVDTTDYDLMAASAPGVDTLGKVPLAIVAEPVRVAGRCGRRCPWEQTVIYEAHVDRPDQAAPGCSGRPARYLRRGRPPCRHRAPEEPQHHRPGTAAGARPRRRARAVRHRPAELLGLLDAVLLRRAPRIRVDPGQELAEFVAMVDALHAAGIEVILDVVYNHTCEGGPDLPVELSWRGLAPGHLLPAAGPRHHRHRVHGRPEAADRGADGHRLAAVLGHRTGRRRLPVRPGVGARPAGRRCLRPGSGHADRHRRRPGAVRPAS